MKPGPEVAAVGATTEALTAGAVLSTVALKLLLLLLVALSVAVSVYVLAPAARTAVAVRDALRYP